MSNRGDQGNRKSGGAQEAGSVGLCGKQEAVVGEQKEALEAMRPSTPLKGYTFYEDGIVLPEIVELKYTTQMI
jgi:hypothetical protein